MLASAAAAMSLIFLLAAVVLLARGRCARNRRCRFTLAAILIVPIVHQAAVLATGPGLGAALQLAGELDVLLLSLSLVLLVRASSGRAAISPAARPVSDEGPLPAWAEDTQVAVFIFSDTIHAANAAALALCGYAEEALLAMPFWRLAPPEAQAALRAVAEKLLRRGAGRERVEVRLLTRQGEDRWGDLSAGLVDYRGRPAILATVVDITGRKREEQAGSDRERRLSQQHAALGDLARHHVLRAEDLHAALRSIAESAVTALDVTRVSIWLLDEERKLLSCLDGYHVGSGPLQADLYSPWPVSDFPAYLEALEAGLVIAAADVAQDPRTRELAEFHLHDEVAATLDAPIRLDGRLCGVVRHEVCTEQRHWALDEQNFAISIAELAALALDQARRYQAEQDLFREKERALVTLQAIGDGVITTDISGVIEYLNPIAEHLTGWTLGEARGRHLSGVLILIEEGSRQHLPDPVKSSLREGGPVCLPGDVLLVPKSGEREHAMEVTVSPIRDPQEHVIGTVLVLHDVTELRRMTRQMAFQATHDALTGLINRREFETRLERALESARRTRRHHALCYLDLDKFKVVNDTCGHGAGDELLKQLAAQLQGTVRVTDTLARLGGDEFGVLLEDCPLDHARRVADDLRNVVRSFRFIWEDKIFEVGVSIGLVPIAAESGPLADVLSAADSACYMAKDQGRNRVHVFEPDDAELARHHGELQWLQQISRAFEEGRFHLYCQRIDPITSQADLGGPMWEMLIRMVGEGGAIVPASEFVPAAERYHFMPTLDRWVIRSAFRLLRSRRDIFGTTGVCTVNLSGQSLGDGYFLNFVVDQLEQSGLAPDAVCFEITETAAIANLTHAQEFIGTLKGMGCRFALDDFGSGLSSFAYLKNLPVDYLKIDGAFVRDMASDPIDYAMVEAINQIGHVMGLRTIAEFVEDEATLRLCQELQVDYVQGFGVEAPRLLEAR